MIIYLIFSFVIAIVGYYLYNTYNNNNKCSIRECTSRKISITIQDQNINELLNLQEELERYKAEDKWYIILEIKIRIYSEDLDEYTNLYQKCLKFCNDNKEKCNISHYTIMSI